MRVRVPALVLGLLCVDGSPSLAQVEILTEAQALARLSTESPRVRAIRAGVDVIRADRLAAARWPNPSVMVSRESVAGGADTFATVSQPLPVTGQRRLDTAAVEATVRLEEFRAADLERRVGRDLLDAFATLRLRQAREDELSRLAGSLRDLAAVLATREAAGDAAGFDRLRAEQEAQEAEADRGLAAAARAESQAALAAFFWPAVDPATLRVSDALGPPFDPPPAATLVEVAERIRPDLRALASAVEAARAARQAAGRRAVPEPELVVGSKSVRAATFERGYVMSLIAAVPLFDRFGPEKARAEAEERRASAELEALRAELAAQVAGVREAALQRHGVATSYRSAGVARAGELQRIARVSYDAGERGILELLDAYRSAASARLRLSALEFEAAQAALALEWLTGWERPR